jgi:uncharacterized protein YjbK
MANQPDSGTEVELKFAVDGAAAFDALARAAGTAPRAAKRQVNHFFDTADGRLNASKHTIRLRDEEGSFTLTAKGPETRSAQGPLMARSEEEVAIDRDEATAILRGTLAPLDTLEQRLGSRGRELIAALRTQVGGSKLAEVGSFENERSRLPVRLSIGTDTIEVEFEMDRTTFPGNRVDYEVEVELVGVDEDRATAAVKAFFAKAQVPWRDAPSKAKRFFDAIQGGRAAGA